VESRVKNADKKMALLIKGMNFSLTQRRGSAVLGVSPMSDCRSKDAKVRFLKVQFGNFIPRFSNAKKIIKLLNPGYGNPGNMQKLFSIILSR
jgi:hypothetical protein